MTDNNNIITINPNVNSTITFDVVISGLDKAKPNVRFILEKVKDGMDWVINCTKVKDTQWEVSFPTLKDLKLESCSFSVEVIVDEYYFQTANGTLNFVSASDVKFKGKNKKPTVTSSFKVKEEVVETVTTAQPPLQTEEDPIFTQSSVKVKDSVLDDQIDKEKLDAIADDITPGDGAQIPDDNERVEQLKAEFDPKSVAENILKNKFKLGETSTKKGSLFSRGTDGKVLVPGLLNPQQQKELDEREKKVRDILK